MSCRSTGNWFVGYVSPYALRRVMTDSTNLTGTTWLDYRALLTSVSRVQVVILISLMVLVALSEGISFLMLVPMLNTMLGPDSVPHPMLVDFGGIRLSVPLYALLTGFVALVGVRSIFQHFRSLVGIKLENQVVDTLRLRCFAALMHAEWRLVARQRLSDYASLIITNVDRVGFGLNQFISIAALAVTAVACIGAAFILSWRLALFAIVCGLFVVLAFRQQRRRARALGTEQNVAYEGVYAQVQEGLAGIRIAKVFRQEERHIAQVGAVFKALRAHQISFMRSASLGRSALNTGGASLLALTIFLGLSFWHLPIPSLLPLVVLFARLLPVVSGLQQSWENLLHATPALSDVSAMLDEISANSEPVAPSDGAELALEQEISLDHVEVIYSDRGKPALFNVSLTIPARTTTVVTGQSGAGKSTLADVLMGLIVPDSGLVKVDGVRLTGPARMRWRRSVAYVQQDPFLFNASIRSNLLWARPHSTDAELGQALQAASAGFVNDLPNGLDTVVGDGGIRLSGGERQRIVLARALLCKPSLLILDEATSALDPDNERAIRQAITVLHGALTLIVIGHRVAMVDAADQLISLKNGRIATLCQANAD